MTLQFVSSDRMLAMRKEFDRRYERAIRFEAHQERLAEERAERQAEERCESWTERCERWQEDVAYGETR